MKVKRERNQKVLVLLLTGPWGELCRLTGHSGAAVVGGKARGRGLRTSVLLVVSAGRNRPGRASRLRTGYFE